MEHVFDQLKVPEETTIIPAPSLLHEDRQVLGCVCESLGIRNVLDSVACLPLDVHLQAHDAIFGQVFVRFGACWSFRARHILEKHVQRAALNGLPSEHAISTGQDCSVAEKGLAGLVRSVTELILVELGGLQNIA